MKKRLKYKTIYELLDTDEETLDDVIANKANYYYSYPIRKKNGTKRYIDAPVGILKEWQEKIAERLLYRFSAHPIAYGFTKNRNPIMAAEVHVGANMLIAMDLKNFFSSIKKKAILETLVYLNYKEKLFDTIHFNDGKTFTQRHAPPPSFIKLTELLTFKGVVPQGAPSSPALTNLFMLRADKQLSLLAKETGSKVTRYADDIVFSKETYDTDQIIQRTRAILKSLDLKLNPDKIHVNRKHRRMRVVGIVVNEKTNIPREKWRNFRAKLHNLKKSQEPIPELMAQKLRGQIEWIRSVNPSRGSQFLKEYGLLNFMSTSSTSTVTTT